MSTTIERPYFLDEQVLTADDLNGMVDYLGAQQMRHARLAHTWGIVSGLKVSKTDEVQGGLVLSPGFAVDMMGRPLVVRQRHIIRKADFENQLGKSVDDGFYPVFLTAVDDDAPAPLTDDPCGVRRGRKLLEEPLVTFDRRFQAQQWLKNGIDADKVSGELDPDADVIEKRVLVGFVKVANNAFDSTSDSADGVAPRFAGLRAGEIVSGKQIALRSKPAGVKDSPIILLGDLDGQFKLVMGLDDGTGKVVQPPLLSINKDGTLLTAGAVNPRQTTPTSTFAQSGTVADGMTVPLPRDMTDEDLKNPKTQVHIHLMPRPDLSPSPNLPGATTHFGVPQECSVDENRRVKCEFRWLKLGGTATNVVVPGTCDYLILVSVSQ